MSEKIVLSRLDPDLREAVAATRERVAALQLMRPGAWGRTPP